MAWREALLRTVGPGVLGGITLGDWLGLLREERFAIAPSCIPRALSITAQGVKNSLWLAIERRRFGARIEETVIEPPLFVLGHWRNGTTHLHNLLSSDRRFAFPNTYETFYPHTFLSTEAWTARFIRFFIPARRPMDNVEIGVETPQEDEFALCAATLKSPCMAWVLPERRERFEKYLTMRGVPPEEVEEWRAALRLFLKKLTLKHGRRTLILKSPPHTARVRLLLEMFPEARFVHIHRHPRAVFQSTKRMLTINIEWHRIQRLRLEDLDDWIIRQYREMYEAYFEERSLVPRGRLHEVRFEELEKDPIGQIEATYQGLGLPDFEAARPALEKYVASISGYRKNDLPVLPAELQSRIAREWRRSFEEWGYEA